MSPPPLPVELVASIKSVGDFKGSPVISDRCLMAVEANLSSAQIPVPMAVPPMIGDIR